jgi:orotidine-5'-phosphate decarboxylase
MTGDRSWRDRLATRCEAVGTVLCAGIDPSPDACALVPSTNGNSRAARIEHFGRAVVEAVAEHAAAVKLQAAWFEHAGVAGIEALSRIVDDARAAGLLVVFDGKRGDIPHSAHAYAEAWLGEDAASGICCDAMTISVWTGGDALGAMSEVADARGCGLYALVHTSNPGARAVQNAELADGRPWWHVTAAQVGAAGCGAVVPGTNIEVLKEARKLMPEAPLLVPGVGAQGGDMADVLAAAGVDAPVLVAASRSLLPDTAPTSLSLLTESIRDRAQQMYHSAS